MWSFRGVYMFRAEWSSELRAALARPPMVRELGDRRYASGCYRSFCPLYRRSLPWEQSIDMARPGRSRQPSQ